MKEIKYTQASGFVACDFGEELGVPYTDDTESLNAYLARVGYYAEDAENAVNVESGEGGMTIYSRAGDSYPFVVSIDRVCTWIVVVVPTWADLTALRIHVAPMLLLDGLSRVIDDLQASVRAFRHAHHDHERACGACESWFERQEREQLARRAEKLVAAAKKSEKP